MALFYLAAGALALLTAVVLVMPLVRRPRGAQSRDERDAALYRDQLAEIDRDLARGAINAAEAEGARAEVSRRLLSAAERIRASRGLRAAPLRFSRLAAGLAVVGAPVVAAIVYLGIGSPTLPDEPFAARLTQSAAMAGGARPTQAEAEAMMPKAAAKKSDGAPGNYAALISRLEKVMRQRPGDVQGLDLLARGYMRLGRYHDAWQTYSDLIKATGDKASAEQYASMAEAMVLAAGGYVSPKAERAIEAALKSDPKQATARYYHALAMAQAGHLDAAIAAWKRLKADAPPDAPFMPFLDRTLAQAQALRSAGSSAPGPSVADMAAAQGMSPKQRQAMIEGMVSRLEQRLTTKGGKPEEWARLMNAYVQLGRPKDAARVAKLGIAAMGSGAKADFLRQKAKQMGLKLE